MSTDRDASDRAATPDAAAPAIPAPASAEDVRRRRFLYVSLGVMGAGVAGTVVGPALPYVLHPLEHETVKGGNDFVPVGKLTVNVMHPKIPGAQASQQIEIQDGAVARVDLQLKYTSPPNAGAPADAGPEPRLH